MAACACAAASCAPAPRGGNDAERVAHAHSAGEQPGWTLFAAHCLPCHSEGASAPIRLDHRTAIARKAATIRTVIAERFMPPWLPDGGVPLAGHHLTEVERDAIATWAAAGAVGAPDSPATAQAVSTDAQAVSIAVATGWSVPADGAHMRTFVVASRALPSRVRAVRLWRASASVERALLSVDATGLLARLDESDPGDGMHARGDSPRAPAGSLAALGADGAFALPTGWSLAPEPGDLAVELHAVGRGSASTASVRLDFLPGSSSDRIAQAFVAGPHGALEQSRDERRVRTRSSPLTEDAELVAIALRADDRCASIRAVAQLPGGEPRELLLIPKYREALDRTYLFAPPVALPQGATITVDAEYDDAQAARRAEPSAILWGAPQLRTAHPVAAHSAARSDPSAGSAGDTGVASWIIDALDPQDTGSRRPSEGLTWFEAVEACNARSVRDGLSPAYRITHEVRINGRLLSASVMDIGGRGWRLPSASTACDGQGLPPGAQWLWTATPADLADCIIRRPSGQARDRLPPSARVPGIWAEIVRPALDSPGT